ncbi:uncharacterized protein LOC130666162 [Microplitis mediator]|uniref:uncharacterized protein LOC130666162 n=1 Tax=Microplitis mediator TaxID=375433 RepID=UPI0025569E26|nr:uncharacterized protein LOC130666162 [Microplitis mediator]
MRSVYTEYCLSTSTLCNHNSDCCSKNCVRVKGNLYSSCAATAPNLFDNNDRTNQRPSLEFEAGHCQPNGRNCFMDDDCCSKNCMRVQFPTSLSQLCAPGSPNSTEVITQACGDQDKQKIEKAPNCIANGEFCHQDEECCSKSCRFFGMSNHRICVGARAEKNAVQIDATGSVCT